MYYSQGNLNSLVYFATAGFFYVNRFRSAPQCIHYQGVNYEGITPRIFKNNLKSFLGMSNGTKLSEEKQELKNLVTLSLKPFNILWSLVQVCSCKYILSVYYLVSSGYCRYFVAVYYICICVQVQPYLSLSMTNLSHMWNPFSRKSDKKVNWLIFDTSNIDIATWVSNPIYCVTPSPVLITVEYRAPVTHVTHMYSWVSSDRFRFHSSWASPRLFMYCRLYLSCIMIPRWAVVYRSLAVQKESWGAVPLIVCTC